MAITIERDKGLQRQAGEQFGLECPYCGVYSHMTPESVPDLRQGLPRTRPETRRPRLPVRRLQRAGVPALSPSKQIRMTTKSTSIRNFIELERPRERFQFSYLPKQTEGPVSRGACPVTPSNNFQRVRLHVPAGRGAKLVPAPSESQRQTAGLR